MAEVIVSNTQQIHAYLQGVTGTALVVMPPNNMCTLSSTLHFTHVNLKTLNAQTTMISSSFALVNQVSLYQNHP